MTLAGLVSTLKLLRPDRIIIDMCGPTAGLYHDLRAYGLPVEPLIKPSAAHALVSPESRLHERAAVTA